METRERNRLFMEQTPLIHKVMCGNYCFIRSCRLSWQDVRQDLALRMLIALDAYRPELCPNLEAYLRQRMKFELLQLSAPERRYGVSAVPRQMSFRMLSLDARDANGQTIPVPWQDESILWLKEEIAGLPDKQRAAITGLLYGGNIRCSNKMLQAARRHIRTQMDEIGIL